MTSTQAVGAVRRLFDARKAGHAGTLDPLATGVLPIALGEATKTVPYAVDGTKHYRFTVRWGAGTDTDDAEGRIVATSELRPSREAIEALLPRFTGEIMQMPPAFSAIKVDGDARLRPGARRRDRGAGSRARCTSSRSTLHRHAGPRHRRVRGPLRQGHLRARARPRHGRVARLPRPPDRAAAHPRRSVRRGAGGHPRRARGRGASRARRRCTRLLLPIEAALQDLAELSVGQNDAARLLRGQAVLIRGRDAPTGTGPTYATCKGHLIAVGRIDKGELHPVRVFNFSNAG